MKKRVLSEVLMCMAIVVSLGACGGTTEEAVKKEIEAVVETAVSDSEESNESHEKSDVVQETLVTEQSDSAESVDKLPEETEEGDENTNNSSTEESAEADLIDGMRPDFKEAMDSYETFYEEYCDFMEKYNENPSDLSLIMEYTEMLARSTEMSEKFEEWNTDDLNDAEMKYYMEVNNRVAQMLVDVAY